jgi:hypothetical protein
LRSPAVDASAILPPPWQQPETSQITRRRG